MLEERSNIVHATPTLQPDLSTPPAPASLLSPGGGAWVALLGALAVWATREDVLPGRTHGWWGAALQAALWLCLYVGLCKAYGSVPLPGTPSHRRTTRRLALALVLALAATAACIPLFDVRLAPASWLHFFYLRWLAPLALLGLCCAALLPRGTAALLRAGRNHAGSAPLPDLAILLASAVLLVSFGDLLLQPSGSSPIEARLQHEVIEPTAWATTALLLFSAQALLYAITRRLSAALLLVCPVYLVLALVSLANLKYLHAAIQPLDLLRIPEFLPLFRSFFGLQVLVATLLGLGLWLVALAGLRRLRPRPLPLWRRWTTAFLSLVVLLAVPTGFLVSESHPRIKALLLRLGAPNTQHREQARLSGFLLDFLSQLPAAFVTTPPGYSASAIAEIRARYSSAPGPIAPGPPQPHRVNLVMYLVESFVDPATLGFHFTADPVPNLRALSRERVSGHAYVPERFGGSANTEFELLTGMTRRFLPDGSVPYRQYLRRPVPSLPRLLHQQGYATTAIQADPKYYYDRERVYPLLGFDRVVWLQGAPGVEHAPRGPWPADRAVVQAVIEASRGPRPFFAFAFPSSTHSPYHYGTYAHDGIALLDPPAGEAAEEVKEYVNAVRVADQAIGGLVDYFRQQPDSTVIVVLGDHVPPLSQAALRPFFTVLDRAPVGERDRLTHRVPLLIWTNFPLPRDTVELGTNAIPPYLLDLMGVRASGLLALVDTVRRAMPILPEAGGRDSDSRLLQDYRLAQYDLLLGRQYLVTDSRGFARSPE